MERPKQVRDTVVELDQYEIVNKRKLHPLNPKWKEYGIAYT